MLLYCHYYFVHPSPYQKRVLLCYGTYRPPTVTFNLPFLNVFPSFMPSGHRGHTSGRRQIKCCLSPAKIKAEVCSQTPFFSEVDSTELSREGLRLKPRRGRNISYRFCQLFFFLDLEKCFGDASFLSHPRRLALPLSVESEIALRSRGANLAAWSSGSLSSNIRVFLPY